MSEISEVKIFLSRKSWIPINRSTAVLHTDMSVEMFIEWPEGIMDLGIITKEFMEEYCILLGN